MPVSVSYPGVYIQELPSGSRTIAGIPTSITAFVGYTARGHDNLATRLLSFADYERRFGAVTGDSLVSHHVRHFFDNGGGQAVVVRVPKPDSVAASIDLRDGVEGGAGVSFTLTARSRGAWGNRVVAEVDHDGAADGDAFNLSLRDLATGASERFRNVSSSAASPRYVQKVVNDPVNGSDLVRVAVPGTDPGGRPAQTGLVGGDFTVTDGAIAPPIDTTEAIEITVTASRPSGITDVYVRLAQQGETLPTTMAGLARHVERRIATALDAALPGAGVRVVLTASGLGLRIIGDFDAALYPDAADTVLSLDGVSPGSLAAFNLDGATSNVAHYALGSAATEAGQAAADTGEDGTQLPRTADLIGSAEAFTGIHALEKIDLFNIMTIPDATRASVSDSDVLDPAVDPNAIFAAAMSYCERRRAFLIIDPPPGVNDVDAALAWISGGLTVAGPNAAAYFPRVRIPDPSDEYRPRAFGPSGVLAGLYARTDGARGIWKAPAGTDASLRTVTGPVYKLTDAENGLLNPLGLNCLRSLPVYGNISWGARTRFGADVRASEWKYIPVRRLALNIEESLYRGIQWAVFEPNDEPLWSQLRTSIGDFMHDLFTKGAFQGLSARDAYFVKCDSSTTTQFDIDRGIVNVVVGFAPLKPAEFVILSIQQIVNQE